MFLLLKCDSICFAAISITKLFLIQVQPFLFYQQFLFGLSVVRIIHTAIYGTNCRTLWLFMKARAFGTLPRHDIVDII